MDPVSSSPAGDDTKAVCVGSIISAARKAQRQWAMELVGERLKVVKAARRIVAGRAVLFAGGSGRLRNRDTSEVLTAEVLPLLEAHRFLEKRAEKLLQATRLGRSGRPAWLGGVTTEVLPEPRGIVLIVAPRNFPLMLPGIQIAQALAAGNAVLVKPAPGCSEITGQLVAAWREAGLPRYLLQMLPEKVEIVDEAIRAGVDYVVLTGSEQSGRAVYRMCAERLIPATMELSGSDCVIVREDADVEMASAALAFGLQLNAGETCIAPRRAFVARRVGERLEAHLAHLLGQDPGHFATAAIVPKLNDLIEAVHQRGGSVITGGRDGERIRLPLIVAGGREVSELMSEEIFGAVLVMTFVDTDDEALTLAGRSPYALGATIFSADDSAAREMAKQLNAGVVLINDMIVPTADPRVPFGGRARSGFGVTRGVEGLVSMTVPKVISRTGGKRRRHFEPVESATELFAGYIQLVHGRFAGRWAAVKRLWRGIRNLRTRSKKHLPDQHEQQ